MANATSELADYSDEQPPPYRSSLDDLVHATALNDSYALYRQGMQLQAQNAPETKDQSPWQRFKRWFQENRVQAGLKRRVGKAQTGYSQ